MDNENNNKLDLIFQVKLGNNPLYDWCTESVKKYAKRNHIAYIQHNTPVMNIQPDWKVTNRSKESCSKFGCLPVFEKECAFDYFGTFNRIAIIDADVFIRPNAPNIFDELNDEDEPDFAGVIESHLPITEQYRKKIQAYSKGQYQDLVASGVHKTPWYYDPAIGFPFWNMGIMLMNNSFKYYLDGMSAKQFLEKAEFKRFIDAHPNKNWKWSTDQTLLNHWIRKVGMKTKDLDWRFNVLYKAVKDEAIKDAHFIHFFLKDLLPEKGNNIEQLKKEIGA